MKKMILAAAALAIMTGVASTGAMADDTPMKILGKTKTEATAAQAVTSEPAGPATASTATAAVATTPTLQEQNAQLQASPSIIDSVKNFAIKTLKVVGFTM